MRPFFLLCLLAACSPAAPPPEEQPDAAVDASTDSPPPDAGSDVFVPTKCVNPSVSLAKDVQPMLAKTCSGAEFCHGITFRTPQSTYGFLTGSSECSGKDIVTPGDPNHSYIIDKLTDRDLCSGSPMPKSFGGPWTQTEPANIQLVYDWICGGAQNN